jgi:hypothetical protein
MAATMKTIPATVATDAAIRYGLLSFARYGLGDGSGVSFIS